MLNISENSVGNQVKLSNFKAYKKAFNKEHYKMFNLLLKIFGVLCIIVIFLPWTQTINSQGSVTTLKPDQRPQTIQSVIPGRIEKWHVKEGDFVKKGDTILRISEVKSEYFDPRLVERTNKQIQAKTSSVQSYGSKINALNTQVSALLQEQKLKLEQAKNKIIQSNLKVKSDSINFEAQKTNLGIAETQFERTQTLAIEGLKATKDVEEKRLKLQETQAKVIAQENKYLASKNEVLNAKMELNRIRASYADKISKSQSDRFTAESNQFDAEAQVTKLENQNSNYELRNSLYYITAPQNGYINKALKTGLGETFKEGEKLVGIMPSDYDVAIETYVEPIDLPLVHIGETFRVQFDGWPAIVFSGWPNVSYGTYGAKVVAIENFISPNGKFRILLAPDAEDHKWPKAIRVGSGAKTIGLLEDVPIWYELWRKLNGFPQNYYTPIDSKKKTEKK